MRWIYYTGAVQGFCIVSSDSDYMLLAQRIREEGLLVLGYGEQKTLASLKNRCHEFRFSDKAESVQPNNNTPDCFIDRNRDLFDKAFETVRKGDDTVTLSLIGGELKKLMPKYKVKCYGCKTLGKLYVKLGKYELVKVGDKGYGQCYKDKTVKRMIPKLHFQLQLRYHWLLKIRHRLSLLLFFFRLIAHGKKGAGGGHTAR